ncbi:uncharacterized protein LOC135809789 [Sycon ciliatum]|uniref:uncharacterized protein LOC135809789 n=1 Tax=Sycon ciliatum TaxID=27933 RepID=UPI0020AA7ADF|eukprot:scpid86374/ scgid29835/ 
MSLSVYALISIALLVLAGPSAADTYCGLVTCPPDGYPDLVDCCSNDSLNTGCCSGILLAGWAIGVIATGCILTVGGIIMCCLCCACCPCFQYRQQRQTTYVTTTAYQPMPVATAATTTRVYT